MKSLIITIASLCIFLSCTREIKFGSVSEVTIDEQSYSIVSIATNPVDPANRVISTLRIKNFTLEDFQYEIAVFVSNDGGVNWIESSLPRVENEALSNGSSVIFSNDGVLYVAYSVRVEGKTGSQIIVQKSVDKGYSWNQTTVIPTLSNDTPKLSISASGAVYVTTYGRTNDPLLNLADTERRWTIIVAKSTDQAETFEVSGVTLDNDLFFGVYNLAVFSNGDIWLPFSQFTSNREVNTSHIYGLSSLKEKTTIDEVDHVVELTRRVPRMANTVVDKSDVYKDRLYLAYSQGHQDSLKTAVIFSEDKGKTWSKQVILNMEGQGYFSQLPRIAVHQNGVVGVSWLQTEASDNRCWNMYFSYSEDGGHTFSEPKSLSENPSCPDTINELGEAGFFNRFYGFGGDYTGLTATENGFQAAWSDLSSGELNIYTRNISIQ